MSWFKRRPCPKEAPKLSPHRSMGPITRNLWNQTKQASKQSQETKELKKTGN